jgi:hypothetical protein
VDRQSNKAIASKVGDGEITNAYKMIHEILYNHSSDYIVNNEKPTATIENLCTDGHHS